MLPSLPLPVLASLRAALDQPVFPGKVVVWLLFMLSIVGWVMILSKAAQLRKFARADGLFTERLRKSKTTLEAYEEGVEDENSPKSAIYQAGAREAAYLLLGSREPREAMRERIRQAGKLGPRPLELLRMSFQAGLRIAIGRLTAGVENLVLVSASAILLGVFGFIWTLMAGFDSAQEFAVLAPKVGGALGFLAIALLVAAPAVLARLVLQIKVRKQREEMERFHDDIVRLFERSFAASVEAPVVKRDPSSSAGGEPTEEKKRYHSIRERLLREDPGEVEGLEVNPIARQAASAGGALRGR